MKKVLVYADDVCVDVRWVADDYTVEDYRRDCEINGWEYAPCYEDSNIELIQE